MNFEELEGRWSKFRLLTNTVENNCVFLKVANRYDGAVNACRLINNVPEPVIFSRDYEVIQIEEKRKTLKVGDKVRSLTMHSIKGEALLTPDDICVLIKINIYGNERLFIVSDTENNTWALKEYDIIGCG